MMIYVLYLLVAGGVTWLSMKAADYVDWLDKKTSLSGAFIGGVMLSAVTSLPELFTSISSTLMLNQPGLCIGNILGSDLFNLTILAILILIYVKDFSKTKTSKGHFVVLISIVVSFFAIFLNWMGIVQIQIWTFSLTSVVLIICYCVSIKYLAAEDGEVSDEADSIPLSIKQIVISFIIVSIGIIALSIMISYITDNISEKLNLGKGIAGALFMGIATSLPEVTSSISLFRKRNYDIAVGNIIGSNIFNLFILGFVDVIYAGKGIYDFTDPKTINLMVFGLISSLMMFFGLKIKNKYIKGITCVIMILCYIGFLVI